MISLGGGFVRLARRALKRRDMSSLSTARIAELGENTDHVTEEMIFRGAQVVQARHGGEYNRARLTAFHCFLKMGAARRHR